MTLCFRFRLNGIRGSDCSEPPLKDKMVGAPPARACDETEGDTEAASCVVVGDGTPLRFVHGGRGGALDDGDRACGKIARGGRL